MTPGDDHLAQLATILDVVGSFVAEGRSRYDRDVRQRLALQRMWIAAGECARRYCDAASVDLGEEPWSSIWGYRNVSSGWESSTAVSSVLWRWLIVAPAHCGAGFGETPRMSMSCSARSSCCFGAGSWAAVSPGLVLVVEGAGTQAPVEDADQTVESTLRAWSWDSPLAR